MSLIPNIYSLKILRFVVVAVVVVVVVVIVLVKESPKFRCVELGFLIIVYFKTAIG